MFFQPQIIPFAHTGKFPRLFLDYLNGSESVKPFYSFFPDNAGYDAAIASFKYEEGKRKIVGDVISGQYGKQSLPHPLLDKFLLPGTLTVCTGHQLCLFTGPLYFIYKIISTISLAKKLEAETGKPVVPVYWMASEDHDFEEIASVNLFGKTLRWENPVKGPAGRLNVISMHHLVGELKNLAGTGEHANHLLKIIEEAYEPGRSLAEATRMLVRKIFNEKILVLNPDDAELKRLFLPHMEMDIFENLAQREVEESIALLKKNGYDAQVNPRAINLFYLGVSFRERISFEEGKFKVLNTDLSFSPDELKKELNAHPERFSPNVVMRPLYQQFILPNIAYVGGPGELAYWLEYKSFFQRSGVFFPVLQPRHSVLLIERTVGEKLRKLHLTAGQIVAGQEELVQNFVATAAGEELNLAPEVEKLKESFRVVISKAEAADASLRALAEADLKRMLNAIDTLRAKMLRAEKQKLESSVTRIRKIHEKFFPEGMLQERFENFIPFYLENGETWLQALEKEFDFPVKGMMILESETGAAERKK
ncbi:MAG TPA: bacillithiol biosynthesis cysteine-adding enzyme BshC [Bacteroidia bacterium]|nr:bacillithiol biosynthesis cysteine-adding enzyme BshC [Bacteroidia bacterium]